MRMELQKRSRPRGIAILMYLSVIIGVYLFILSFFATTETEKEIIPGHTLGFVQDFGYVLKAIGIMYISMGIGFWKADVWALKVYKYVNYAISITTIFYAALINNPTGIVPLNLLSAQLAAVTYAFVVNRYLHNKYVKSYFGEKLESTTTDGAHQV